MNNYKIIPISIESLSPINYYFISASGGMRTSSFLGDIALKYATLHQLGKLDYQSISKYQPTYKELNEFEFWYTVGVSERLAFGGGKDTTFMKNMIRNTMQGIDYNGTNSYPGYKVGSKMYKNFYFQQPIRPGNTFYSYLIVNDIKIDFPLILRVGNNKTGIVKINKYSEAQSFKAVINGYTIQNILGKKIPEDINYTYSSHVTLPYYLLGMLDEDQLRSLYES